MGNRFTALRVFGTMWKVLAWITLVLGLLSAVLLLVLSLTVGVPLSAFPAASGGQLVGIAASLLILIAAALLFLLFYASGDLVFVLVSIEENARRTAYILQQQHVAGQLAYPNPPESQAEPEAQEQA